MGWFRRKQSKPITVSVGRQNQSINLVGTTVDKDLSINMVNDKVSVRVGNDTTTYDLSPEGMAKFHAERWASLPEDFQRTGIAVLQSEMTAALSEVRDLYRRDPLGWSSEFHHGAGTRVRNLLRKTVCEDEALKRFYPESWNGYWGWDDFYVAFIEHAAGVHGQTFPAHDEPEHISDLRAEALRHNTEHEERKAHEEDGLHHKYNVTKRSTGQRVTDCFVLVPSKDPAAKVAMAAYADATDNPHLAEDLRAWVSSIEE